MFKRSFLFIAAFGAFASSAGVVPVVSDVEMEQLSSTHDVIITYTLENAPAVVTMDIQTNSADGAWVSIGPQNFTNVTGDVFCLVETESCTIRWRPWKSPFIGNVIAEGNARAVLTAYAVDAPPDYMVVDLAATSNARVRYYPTADFLPGGLLENRAYRTSKMVMRRVPASGVEFTMGNITSGDTPHTAVLTNDYYIGVFELTQGQHYSVFGFYPKNYYYSGADRDLHPCDAISFRRVRESGFDATEDRSDYLKYFWPGEPYGWSVLGRLRARTAGAVEFDLPTEAQWEFAAQAGERGNDTWNDGSYMVAANIPGQSKERGENVTTAAGSFNPNALGLYDMHGNVWEFCLDWYGADISALGGAINISAGDGTKLADGVTVGTHRVKRGGSCHYQSSTCRSSFRSNTTNAVLYNDFLGLRVVCPAKAVK